MVELFKDEAGLRGSLREGPLKACPDLDTLKTKMQRRKAGLMEVYMICFLCVSRPRLSRLLKCTMYRFLSPFFIVLLLYIRVPFV